MLNIVNGVTAVDIAAIVLLLQLLVIILILRFYDHVTVVITVTAGSNVVFTGPGKILFTIHLPRAKDVVIFCQYQQ